MNYNIKYAFTNCPILNKRLVFRRRNKINLCKPFHNMEMFF